MYLFRAFIAFLFISPYTHASGTDSVMQKRWAIAFVASGDNCFRNLEVTSSSSSAQIIAAAHHNEVSMLSGSAGADVTCYFKPKFAVSFGLIYSLKGFSSGEILYRDNNGVPIEHIHLRYHYPYITVPVRAKYFTGGKKLRFYVSGGLSPAFLLYEKTIVMQESIYEGHDKLNYINRPFNLFLEGEFGLDIPTKKRFAFQVGEYESYALRLTSDQAVTNRLTSYGLTVRCYFRL
jgi:hypothetical protein